MNGNKYWYRENVDTRLQDAVDDYNTRKDIDAQMKTIKNNTLRNHIDAAYNGGDSSITITKMNSQTPVMSFDVERDTDVTNTEDKKGENDNVIGSTDVGMAKYQVKNIDFGIVERPRQELQLLKRVVGYRMVLANGQEMFKINIDRTKISTINKDAEEPKYYTYEYKINGTKDYTIFQDLGQIDKSGMITTQIDSEIIEGATVEITYEMLITNMSEKDYATPNYYYCGKIDNASKDLVKISVYSLTDYLDNKLTLRTKVDKSSNGLFNGWGEITSDELTNTKLKSLSAEETDYIKDKYLLNNNSLYDKFLAPTQTEIIELPTSKVLTTAQDKTYSNRADITEVDKKGFDTAGAEEFNLGTPVMVRNNSISYNDAETVSIIPPTGENKNYKLPISVGIVALVVLGAGILLIKKVVIKTRKGKAE